LRLLEQDLSIFQHQKGLNWVLEGRHAMET